MVLNMVNSGGTLDSPIDVEYVDEDIEEHSNVI